MPESGQTYEFGDYRLVPEERVLLRAGRPVPLTPKAFDTLVVLVSNAGHLVRKEQLLREVWPDTYVEEANLSYTISLLRRALEDGADGRRFIETVQKVGYRFGESVRSLDHEPPAGRAGAARLPSQPARPLAGRRRALTGAVLLLAAGAAWLFLRDLPPRIGPGAAAPPSIVVLPFRPLGGPDHEYFADGITDAVTTELAQVRGLAVISRNSAFAYKGRQVDARAAGTALAVSHVLDGTVQRVGDRLRVEVRLDDAATGDQVWTDTFDRDVKDVFALQDAIATSVAGALSGDATSIPPRRPTTSLAAYDEYLRGRFLFHANRVTDAHLAIQRLERATALDPQFGLAHAALATAYASRFFYREPTREIERKAYAEIEKALAIDPGLAEAHLARADLTWTLANGFPHEDAVVGYRRVLSINPNLVDARTALARVLMHVGLLDEALAELRMAARLDPSDREASRRISFCYYFQHRHAQVLQELERTGDWESWFKATSLMHLGRLAEARQVARASLDRAGDSAIHALHLSSYAVLLARTGDRGGAERTLADLEAPLRNEERYSHRHHTQYNAACAYALLGRTREAVRWLRTAAAEGFPNYPFFKGEPSLAGLRGVPEFDAFMADLERRWERLRAALAAS